MSDVGGRRYRVGMSEEPGESVPEASAAAARTVPPNGMRTFLHVLVNLSLIHISEPTRPY